MRPALVASLGAAGVTILGGIPRILLAMAALPEGLRPFVWSDPLFVYERGLSGHRLPYLDTPFEYPPLIGIGAGALSLFSNGPATFVVAWTLLSAIAAAGCAFALARVAGPVRTWRFWVLTPQLLLFGTVNFDLVPVVLVTLAVLAQRSRREVAAVALLAAGTAAKLYPLASAPIALLLDRRRVIATVVFVSALALLYVPTSVLPYASAGGVGFYAVGIGANIDSVWGIVERVLVALGVPNAGAVVVALSLLGLAVTYAWHVVPRALRAADPAVAFALATVTVLLWSRLYSPQYSLWILPFFALLGLSGRTFALLAVADAGVFLTIYPLTLVRHDQTDAIAAALLGALAAFVVLRHVALYAIWREASSRAREERADR